MGRQKLKSCNCGSDNDFSARQRSRVGQNDGFTMVADDNNRLMANKGAKMVVMMLLVAVARRRKGMGGRLVVAWIKEKKIKEQKRAMDD